MNRDTSRLVFFSRGIQPGLGDKKNKKEDTQKKARGGLCCGYFSDHEQARLHRFPEIPKAGSTRGAEAEVYGKSRVLIENAISLVCSTNSL